MASHTENSHPNDVNVSEEELQEALCVLAGSDAENCSYSQGYVKRQAVFACNTCTPVAAEPAGVCLACVNKCHDGHEIFELYTKRNFRCDCGNEKFGDFKCKLDSVKNEKNPGNRYNHNFSGRYCTCDRLYTDQQQDDDEMIQCVVCEDWFHSQHLGCLVGEPEELQEMICEGCMNKAPFLWDYAAHVAAPPVTNVSHPEEEEEDDEGGQSGAEGPSTSGNPGETKEIRKSSIKRDFDEMKENPVKFFTECKLTELQSRAPQTPRSGAVFWPYSWRSELCTCTACKKAYVAAEVQFLLDQSDTLLAYEQKGLREPFGQHPLMVLTSSMNRTQQLDVIYGFNELTTSMGVMLEQFAAEGKTLTVEAVNEFFEQLRERKRRRTNANANYQ